jgi:hypothetical protein
MKYFKEEKKKNFEIHLRLPHDLFKELASRASLSKMSMNGTIITLLAEAAKAKKRQKTQRVCE